MMNLFNIEKMKKDLYSSRLNQKDLIFRIDSICSTSNSTFHVIPFSTNKSLLDLFLSKNIGSRKIEIIWNSNDVILYSLSYNFKKEEKEITLQDFFFIITLQESPDIHIAITLGDNTFFKKGLLNLLEGFYPSISLTFLSHIKYKSIITEFFKINSFRNISINKVSGKFRLTTQEENRKKMSAIFWPSLGLEEGFNWVQDNNFYFTSLNLKIQNNYFLSYSRQGMISSNLQFSTVLNDILLPICKIMTESRKFFSKRSRSDNQNKSVNPLIIEFPFEPFEDKKENYKFIDAMKRFQNASISVMHGNPYIHLSVIDYCDGSNYDLWVLSSNRLIIAPQLKGTIESISRLVAHVFDTFAEGKILNYKELAYDKRETL